MDKLCIMEGNAVCYLVANNKVSLYWNLLSANSIMVIFSLTA